MSDPDISHEWVLESRKGYLLEPWCQRCLCCMEDYDATRPCVPIDPAIVEEHRRDLKRLDAWVAGMFPAEEEP